MYIEYRTTDRFSRMSTRVFCRLSELDFPFSLSSPIDNICHSIQVTLILSCCYRLSVLFFLYSVTLITLIYRMVTYSSTYTPVQEMRMNV